MHGLGGEEFVAALPGLGAEEARSIADKLGATIERQEFQFNWRLGTPVPFTVSIGVSARKQGERDVDAIVKRADLALYRAKGGGRNRVEVG